MAAAREAVDARFDVLIACAFNFDAHSSELGSLGSLKILKARITRIPTPCAGSARSPTRRNWNRRSRSHGRSGESSSTPPSVHWWTASSPGPHVWPARFLLSEWANVVDAWGLASLDSYATVQRMGRKSRLGPNQRGRLWPVFEAVRDALAAERYTTWANVFTGLAEAFAARDRKPFNHIVIDEAQDLAPAELRFFSALAPKRADALFLSGDVGQRIFQHPYSWASLGVEVRGRSQTLRVCYRTSQQIRRAADRLLPAVLRDSDGSEDERRGVISVFEGPVPEIRRVDSVEQEAETVRDAVARWIEEGIRPTRDRHFRANAGTRGPLSRSKGCTEPRRSRLRR